MLIEDEDWRQVREKEDDRTTLEAIVDPVPDYQWRLWNIKDLASVNIDDLPNEPVSSSNFEDCLGHYSLLGEGLSWKSAHHELLKCYHMKKQEFRKNILLSHLDRNEGVEMGTQEVSEK